MKMQTAISPAQGISSPCKVGFLLLEEYSLIAFANAVEPLRMANRIAGRQLYEWSIASVEDSQTQASAGLVVACTQSWEKLNHSDLLVLCGGEHIHDRVQKRLLAWLRKQAGGRTALGALCTASYVLARAELLEGYRCTIHWENFAGMREAFPNVIVSQEVFEIDRDRLTASGGTAPLDMMLNFISSQHGGQLASAISEAFICERIRGRNDRQRVPLRLSLGTSQPKLVEAVSLMEANLEEPMSLDELAQHVKLSRRQLERLFQKHLNCVPTRHYLELRLARARQLLLQTSMSIVDVAFACGFVSAPHFSKCYRDFFGMPPRDERNRRNQRAKKA